MNPVVVRHSNLERLLFVLAALIMPVGVAVGVTLWPEDPPGLFHWISFAIYGLLFLWFAWISFRFVVRVDENEIYHREIVTRRIPLADVQAIQIASETKGMVVHHTKVQIQGTDSRIMVAWRKGKMQPFVDQLLSAFPEKIQHVDRLPDV